MLPDQRQDRCGLRPIGNPAPTNSTDQAIAILCTNSALRVWSVIVTIFGDLALNENDQISGALLSRLTQAMGIKPEAMRVALHRLRKDGWISSERHGRTSSYQLTPRAFAESQAVRHQIYSSHAPIDWQLVMHPPAFGDTATMVKIARGTYLHGGSEAPNDQNSLIIGGGNEGIPDWIKEIVNNAELAEKYRSLERLLGDIEPLLKESKTPFQIAVLRILIVHNWRRIILRCPNLPAQFYLDDWPGTSCREQVSTLLIRLERPNLGTIKSASNQFCDT